MTHPRVLHEVFFDLRYDAVLVMQPPLPFVDLLDIPFFKEVTVEPSKSMSNLDPITFSVSATSTAIIMSLRIELVTDLATISVLFVQYKYKPGAGGTPG